MKKVYTFIIVCITLLVSGCSNKNTLPFNVFFKDLTQGSSKNYVFSIIYLSDTDMEQFYTDIMIKTNKNDVEFNINLEGKESIEIYIDDAYRWYSLTELINSNSEKKIDFEKFDKILNKNYILNAKKRVVFTIKAIRGDLNDQGNSLINIHDASEGFKIEVENI